MINNVLSKVFGTHNDRELKRISEAFLGPINSLEPSMEKLSDSDLSRKTEEFKDLNAHYIPENLHHYALNEVK